MSRSKLVFLSLLGALAVSAGASASASALHWYAVRCNHRPSRNGTSPIRNPDNGQCEGSLSLFAHLYELENFLLAEKELLKLLSKGGLQIISATIAGVGLKVLCKELHNEGSIEDPAGGGAGKATITALYLACKVDPSTDKCAVAGEMFTAPSLAGALEGTGSSPVVKLSPKEGTTLGELSLEKCVPEALNGKYKLSGSVLAKLSNNGSSILTIKEEKASSMLEVAGAKAGYEGEDEVILEGGGAILAGV